MAARIPSPAMAAQALCSAKGTGTALEAVYHVSWSQLSLVSPKVFFSVLSPMEFWFLAVVASGLLIWGHFISSDITDLIAQILFKLN